MSSKKDMLLVGKIIGPRGIRGELFLQSFMDNPTDIFSYLPLQDEEGKKEHFFTLVSYSKHNRFVVRLQGIASREDADKISGEKLFIDKNLLPKPYKDEFYIHDLIGLQVKDDGQQVLGEIIAIEDYGAGAIVVWKQADGLEEMTPFAEVFFGEINTEEMTIHYKGQ